MQREVEPQKVTLHVARIEFDAKSGIPPELQREISADVQQRTFEEDSDTDYLEEAAKDVAEVAVRGSLQNRGYFKALAHSELTVLKEEGSDIQVAAAVSADLGSQYRVGKIEIKPADPDKVLSMHSQALKRELGLREGEILNVDAIRAALHNLTKIYGKFGFIDMTAEPDFAVDDTQKIIDLAIRIDEQRQYYVKEVQFFGVDQKLEEKLKEELPKSMWLFDSGRLEDFFRKNKNVLPSYASLDDMEVHRSAKEGSVSILFDFRRCPGETK
ncbi:MAG TPA: POTRA domain-containing protein [Candidatus Acidoferrum sp.]|nr:POTRA domain-containing protein [Candidatus Acidoferrum sp.]